MQLLLFIYFIFFFQALFTENIIYLGSMVIVGIIFALTVFLIRKLSIKKTRKLVEKFEKNPNEKIEPFVNVNTADWYVIQELPGLSRVQAKKVVWMRKHNGWYKSFDDFIYKNPISDVAVQEKLKKLIKF